jgi:predicted dinucleotide-binding enzyme
MRIGIIGAGNIGANAAGLFIRAGHEVALSNSRGADSLRELVAELGRQAQALTIAEAARFGEVVLIAIPFGQYRRLPAGEFDGKVVIDAGNYFPKRDGNFPEIDRGQTTSSELMAAHLRGARLVKAFNTIYFRHLADQGDTSKPLAERRAIFIAGDDAAAKATVTRLIEGIGFAAVDTGLLREGGKRQQPGTAIYNQPLTAKQAAAIMASEA